MNKIELTEIVPYLSQSGRRLDQILAELFKEYSRSFLKRLILINHVFINKRIINQPDKKVFGGERITVFFIPQDNGTNFPENIFLDIIYEDREILIINKPSGLVVHPGAGNSNGTILNALLYKYKNKNLLPRSGIVHRLDKYTSGLMVIAKTIFSYKYLVKLLKKRQIVREYQGIVKGNMISGGTINQPIMRHHIHRKRMTVNALGKKSITHYRIIQRFKYHTYISIRLETGRTHQIRVHMLYIQHPLVGDQIYSGINRIPYDNQNKDIKKINDFPRQALHAGYLSFYHPITRSSMSWTVPLPQDMKDLFLYL